MQNMTLADKYLTFSEESKKLLNPETVELLIDTFNKVYLGICDFFNNGEIRNVVFEPDPKFTGIGVLVEFDDDTRIITANNTIKFSPHDKVFEKEWDIDWITHELVHVAQNYGLEYPMWANEGLADYGREKFGLYNKKVGWKIWRELSNKRTYKVGYAITAGFFIWIEKNIDATFSKDLNDTIKLGKYDDNYFIEKTGKTVDELWQMYIDENRANFIIWLEKYMGTSLPKNIFDKIKSGEFDDELDDYLLEKTSKTIDDLFVLWES